MPVSGNVKARRRAISSMRAVGRISEATAILSFSLARSAGRDDLQPQPGVRQAADIALDATAAIAKQLADIRSALIGQIAVSDAAAAARTLAAVDRSRPAGADASGEVLGDVSAPVDPDASGAAAV